jgi:phosphoribosyl-dephospho-CoA transferase
VIPPSRHDLAWLGPSWRSALRAPLDPKLAADLSSWLDRGLPAVVRRRQPGEEGLPLGVALPPGGAARRVALLVAPEVARLAPPLLLADALPSAPPAWRAPLAELEEEARGAGISLAVYGSLAWQHLSGHAYLHAHSDVDLLIRPASAAALHRALALLGSRAELEPNRPAEGRSSSGPLVRGLLPRLDGEILFGGAAVAWRELWAGPERILFKEGDAVGLLPRAALIARLAAEVGQ